MKTKLEVLRDKKERYTISFWLNLVLAVSNTAFEVYVNYEKTGGWEYSISPLAVGFFLITWYCSQKVADTKSEIEMETL